MSWDFQVLFSFLSLLSWLMTLLHFDCCNDLILILAEIISIENTKIISDSLWRVSREHLASQRLFFRIIIRGDERCLARSSCQSWRWVCEHGWMIFGVNIKIMKITCSSDSGSDYQIKSIFPGTSLPRPHHSPSSTLPRQINRSHLKTN